MKNPVAKNCFEFNKPKVFRNRKKDEQAGREKREHPKHTPYKRDHQGASLNHLLDEWEPGDEV